MDVINHVLVLGGTRSGKSLFAETLSGLYSSLTYVATSQQDPSMAARIAKHQTRRPKHWKTKELSTGHELVALLRDDHSACLVDSIGSWIHRLTMEGRDVQEASTEMLQALVSRRNPVVFVSEEVGLAVHPISESAIEFVDLLGELNQRLASHCAEVYFLVAGLPLKLSGSPQQ